MLELPSQPVTGVASRTHLKGPPVLRASFRVILKMLWKVIYVPFIWHLPRFRNRLDHDDHITYDILLIIAGAFGVLGFLLAWTTQGLHTPALVFAAIAAWFYTPWLVTLSSPPIVKYFRTKINEELSLMGHNKESK